MKLHLMGTGGADGIPALFCGGRVNDHARKHRGKDVRSRAAAVVDDTLKLDFGPDTWAQCAQQGLDPLDWTGVLFTHSDADHFAPDELMYALYPFNERDYAGFVVYGNEFICGRVAEKYPDWPFELVETASFSPFCHGGYRITPLRAHHKLDEDAHNYVVQDGRSTLLYATDTGIWDPPTWAALQAFRLDCLVLECTEAFASTAYDGHLDAQEFQDVLSRLRAMGTVHDGTVVVTTHHSHAGEATHAELEEFFASKQVQVGHDGMVLEF